MEEEKVYTDKAMNAATLFGGPLVGGYMLSENFKLFKEDDYSRRVLFGSALFFILFFEIIFMIPDPIIEKIPDMIFPLIYVGIGYWIYTSFQKKKVDEFLKYGGAKQSALKITGITLIGVIITVGYILIRVSFITPFEGEVMVFGEIKHQIYYDESITVNDVKKVAFALKSFGYFESDIQQAVNLTEKDNNYYLGIFVVRDWWEDQAIVESLQELEESINLMGLEKHLKINMIDESFTGRQELLLPNK